jgi:hypothetical protein
MIFFICVLISSSGTVLPFRSRYEKSFAKRSLTDVVSSNKLGLSIASAQNKPLAGDLFFATCNLPECSTLELSLYDLATQSISKLYDFPFDDFEDGYVADSFVIPGSRQVVISLQYDSKPEQGFLLTFDVASKKIVDGFNSSQCFNMWLDPSDTLQDRILCLSLQAKCDGGSQCTELRHLSRSAHTDTLISSFLPNFAPYTVSCLDIKKGLIYSTFGPLLSGHNVFAAIDPKTGKVLSQPTFPISTAYIELEYDSINDLTYGVVEDSDGVFVATIDPASGVAKPVSNAAQLNTTMWNQFNSISTIAPEIGTFFFTAFHYEVPGPPPSDPILHLIGANLTTGSLNFDQIVQNPFCEILWIPSV